MSRICNIDFSSIGATELLIMFGSAQCIVVPGLLIFLSLSAATPVGMVQGSVATHVGQATVGAN